VKLEVFSVADHISTKAWKGVGLLLPSAAQPLLGGVFKKGILLLQMGVFSVPR